MEETNQYFELIRYYLQPGIKQKIVEDFYRDAAIPALNRIGINNVGVFNPVYGTSNLSLFILIPHHSLEAVYTDNEKLLADKELLTTGTDFLNSALNDTAFVKMEKSLLRSFDYLPQVQNPVNLYQIKSRVYEMRIYQSPSLTAAKKKVHMFNAGGEIEIFKKIGLQPVFFGETIVGPDMPNLLYMLVFENMEARDMNWSKFETHPGWIKLRNDPNYANLVSSITDIILKPAACSQI